VLKGSGERNHILPAFTLITLIIDKERIEIISIYGANEWGL